MVMHPHPVKSVLALVVSFFGLAVCYVMLSAPFIAAIQVIVYAGAILVLFLFVLMLLNVGEETRGRERPIQRWLSAAALLFSRYLLPFEALSVLLLAALVGAFVLAQREKGA